MRIEQISPITLARLSVVDIDATLESAAIALSHPPGIGLLIVSNNAGTATGVLTKTDLIRHISDRNRPATVGTLMSRNIIACDPADDLQAAWQVMVNNRLQNMPVIGGAEAKPLGGVLDIRDALKVLFEQERIQEHMLTDYIAGIGY
ncbi:hypothetical protein Q644_03775 [Brucella intermedia 229E]|uniref:CBS domain-containing protein n=1 Tax=Brucella intermedia 229E TaxID=1337887 RepID=U4V4Z1_9HYPH|nr:hypothetical protein Q644_03775 [Brucella intermedia 229E]